jgi:hypothetical protein
MSETLLIALVFLVLLGLEWWYRSKSARLAAAVLALLILFFYQSSAARAARQVISLPPADRVTHSLGTDYASGVATMYEAVADDSMGGSNERLLSIGVLFWLSCSLVLPRARRVSVSAEPAIGEAAV